MFARLKTQNSKKKKNHYYYITMEKEEKFLGIVQMSLHLLSTALDELLIINGQKADPDEIHLLNLPPFKFYRISLQYMITMEFTKLLESDSKYRKNFPKGKTWEDYENTNSASLAKNSRFIYELKGESFEKEHRENIEQLAKIRASDFGIKIKDDRDKKFAHSDADYSGNIYSIKTYSETDIKEAHNVLNDIKEILERCTGAFKNYEFISPPDNRTQNFIHYHIVYNKFYTANLMKAVSEGYTINHLRNGDLLYKSKL